jgi:transcriptional regulator with XRE-family HTH domain
MKNDNSIYRIEKTVGGIPESVLRYLLKDERMPYYPNRTQNATINQIKQPNETENNMDNNKSNDRSTKTMSENELDNLRYCFVSELKSYKPDYAKIAEKNQYKQFSDADEEERKRQAFAAGIRSIREEQGYTCEEMGKLLNVSRQRINEYEHGKFMNIPAEIIEKIGNIWGVSPAYMLGMVDQMGVIIPLQLYYFWEHPENTPYEPLRAEAEEYGWGYDDSVPRKGPTGFDLYSTLTEHIGKDYELGIMLYRLFELDEEAKHRKINAIKAILKV